MQASRRSAWYKKEIQCRMCCASEILERSLNGLNKDYAEETEQMKN